MTNLLSTFKSFTFRSNAVRTVMIDGNPIFLGTDLCTVLGITNTGNAYARLDDDQKTYIRRVDLGLTPGRPWIGVTEGGLYDLILHSSKPEARTFRKWVTDVVLPAIRKDGGYILGEEKVATGEMSEDQLVFKAMQVMATKIERLQSENKRLDAEVNIVTIDEYRSLSHRYWPLAYSVKLGKAATRLCQQRGIEIGKQERKIRTYGGTRTTVLNVYPRAILEEAQKIAGRPPALAV
ncbi:MAG: BRO family protein [Devosia sp.]|nr:BRO family protein [Devosia sp.]